MITIKHRFHGYNSLRGVYRHGQTLRGPSISLKFNRRDSRRPYRAAVVVSRKVNKSAVVRNRIRRRVYEAVREAEVTIEPGLDLVFTVFDDSLAEMPAAKLQSTVKDLLKKATAARKS